MLRIVGVTIPDNVDVFSGMRMIKGLDTKNSHAKIERILTQAGLYSKKQEVSHPHGNEKDVKIRYVKEYPLVGKLTWAEKKRLIDLVDMPRARISNVRISPRKLRLVADEIRGKSVDEALGILSFMPKGGAPILKKLLESAIANASNNHELKADNLFVAKVLVDGGPTMRRFMARARGRACRIRKRTAHAIIVLREKVEMNKIIKATQAAAAKETKAAEAGEKKAKSTKSAGTKTAAKAKTPKTPKAQGGN